MSINDENEDEYKKMLTYIRSIRGSYNQLVTEFSALADSLGMKTTPVDNCTRLPIAFMKSCNWIESVQNTSLYNKSMSCLQITQRGREIYCIIKDMYDMRMDDFYSYDYETQLSLIRIGVYSMLERSGYDITSKSETLYADKHICEKILNGKELLFSPCQTINREIVEDALGISFGNGTQTNRNFSTFESNVEERNSSKVVEIWDLNFPEALRTEKLSDDSDLVFLNRVHQLLEAGMPTTRIVDTLFDEYISSTQMIFYPLIATLFKIMGFDCIFSRAGDNGARWDAIIVDSERSIPIEIKSPTEEQHLSIKAIRQALENKIILLSRKTYKTNQEVTSLAVGYYMPNDRAEVKRLISDIKNTYNYKIGVIDLKSLLSISVSILVDGKGFDKERLYNLEGLANANIH